MTLFAGIMIVVIVFLVMVYVFRTVIKNIVLAKKRSKSQDFFLYQVNEFAVNSLIVFKEQGDLFSQSRMRNAGVEVGGEAIQLIDYIKNVPWFFYL